MKKSTKTALKRAGIVVGSVAAGAGALVMIQKIAAKNGISIAIFPEQITPENEVISKIVSGTVATATGVTAGLLIGGDVVKEKSDAMLLDTIVKQQDTIEKLSKIAVQDNSSINKTE